MTHRQLRLSMLDEAAPVRGALPDLASYDAILVSSSAGKDSQAMLDYVVELARRAKVLDRVVVVHADLGRVEWKGTRKLAEEQARHYGLRFEVVSRIGRVSPGGKDASAPYAKGDVFGDLLDHVERRRMWPGPGNARYCTSDHKRGPIRRVITRLHREHGRRPFRLLQCIGLRAEESPNRAAEPQLKHEIKPLKTKTRDVDTWLPIQHWTEAQVWRRIERSGVPHHPAYDFGMPRLSCVFCIFAPRAALMIAGAHNRELLASYVRIERDIGHTFKNGFAIAEIEAALEQGETTNNDALDGAWNM